MPNENGLYVQLKEAAQLTGAGWAALSERVGGHWVMRAEYRLNKSARNQLVALLEKPSIDAWLCGALSGGHSRSSSLPDGGDLDAGKLMASLLSGRSVAAAQSLLPNLQADLAYDMPTALDKVLSGFVQLIPCQGAWLAIRRGEFLDVQAEWNDPKSRGLSLLIDSSPILRRLNRNLADVSLERGQPNWDNIPGAQLKPGTKSWVCFPLIIGQRLIGAVALWRQVNFTAAELQELRELSPRVAPSVDVAVTFSEMAGHLRRLGMLNDFVLTVSSAQNLDQIARRVFGLLSRAFSTELIALYLLSTDGRLLRDYRTLDGKMHAMSVALTHHPIQPVLREGRLRRVGDAASSDIAPIHSEARSMLFVPLKYRGQVIGVLSIESLRPDAFSQYDEHLMVVIASHLAGLIENGRLREEAEGRARSLGLIHEVVQQVIGLTDKSEVAQITADLLAHISNMNWPPCFSWTMTRNRPFRALAGLMQIRFGARWPAAGFPCRRELSGAFSEPVRARWSTIPRRIGITGGSGVGMLAQKSVYR